ncbi:hypothetical protein BJF83_12220 [Nocardiopsis sp. CNR-923]|uniref:glutaminase n=1 Tax=Nocardiopsis sp. CNR-923 TaxID=1904965 RepID=UPI00096987A3|nr:glutaminase [Nocardiopsis sp. CNR-923]OLT29339.1 hypothetical protein BJF83_12220 [Nocardiopsis sp. CNR-923]
MTPDHDLPRVLDDVMERVRPHIGEGRDADYIPELSKVDPYQSGFAVATVDGVVHTAGDAAGDTAGEFAYRFGLPCKSGVGCGILSVAPGRYAVAAWAPGPDPKRNSAAGALALALEAFTDITRCSVF